MQAREYIASYLAVFLLLFLTATALFANWLPNPLYARVESPFFHNTHALSMLSISVACYWLIWKSKLKGLPMIVVCCVATASIHELTLAVFDMGILGGAPPPNVSPQFVIYLSLFLAVALFKGSHFQRRILAAQFFILIVIYAFDLFAKPGSTIVGSSPSILFYNPFTNAVEVASWLIPAALWFLPKWWVEQWAILSRR